MWRVRCLGDGGRVLKTLYVKADDDSEALARADALVSFWEQKLGVKFESVEIKRE